MSALYRGWWWGYFGGIVVGYMLATRDDWWFMLPALATGLFAVERRVA